jgi:hypothetical protein
LQKGDDTVDSEDLRKACEEFKNEEGRASFYDVALEIVDDHPLQAAVIILAVWNTGRFRFMASDSQNLVDLKKAIEECKPLLKELDGKVFKTAKFDDIENTVKTIYSKLSHVYGVEYTGASKVMHLMNSDLFVMWDNDTREEYEFYMADETDYFDFLKKMQDKFKDIEWNVPDKTFAKAIDEWNQVNISIPKRKERLRGKKKRT